MYTQHDFLNVLSTCPESTSRAIKLQSAFCTG